MIWSLPLATALTASTNPSVQEELSQTMGSAPLRLDAMSPATVFSTMARYPEVIPLDFQGVAQHKSEIPSGVINESPAFLTNETKDEDVSDSKIVCRQELKYTKSGSTVVDACTRGEPVFGKSRVHSGTASDPNSLRSP